MDFLELEKNIIYEDDSIVAISKPAGWVVNRSASYSEKTVQDWTEEKFKIQNSTHPFGGQAFKSEEEIAGEYGSPKEIFLGRGGVVHRLDKDTSGVLLLAKTPSALVELLRQFREREVRKTYIALVHGKITPGTGTIRLPMARSDGDYKKFAVAVDGKLAETDYSLLQYFPGLPAGISEKKGKGYQGFSYLELAPKTGRTHQIRVHLATIKHPIVSDGTYAGKKRLTVDLEWCPRQFLHAATLTFTHPVTEKEMMFEAPLAEDLQESLQKFQSTII